MKERPILFSAEMVRAILDGRKTQTRRVMNPQPALDWRYTGRWFQEHKCYPIGHVDIKSRYGLTGDQLWVRETWKVNGTYPDNGGVHVKYRAGGQSYIEGIEEWGKYYGTHKETNWRPSIFMPRWASRIQLEIVDVRIEQLRAMQYPQDDIAEGVYTITDNYPHQAFRFLWNKINGNRKDKDGKRLPYSWEDNPWVWVVEFKMIGQDDGGAV